MKVYVEFGKRKSYLVSYISNSVSDKTKVFMCKRKIRGYFKSIGREVNSIVNI